MALAFRSYVILTVEVYVTVYLYIRPPWKYDHPAVKITFASTMSGFNSTEILILRSTNILFCKLKTKLGLTYYSLVNTSVLGLYMDILLGHSWRSSTNSDAFHSMYINYEKKATRIWIGWVLSWIWQASIGVRNPLSSHFQWYTCKRCLSLI